MSEPGNGKTGEGWLLEALRRDWERDGPLEDLARVRTRHLQPPVLIISTPTSGETLRTLIERGGRQDGLGPFLVVGIDCPGGTLDPQGPTIDQLIERGVLVGVVPGIGPRPKPGPDLLGIVNGRPVAMDVASPSECIARCGGDEPCDQARCPLPESNPEPGDQA
jgi:hypothetical protein